MPRTGPATTTAEGKKSDLPAGWEREEALPPGAIRLEDLKPGYRPKPPAGEEAVAPAKEEMKEAAKPAVTETTLAKPAPAPKLEEEKKKVEEEKKVEEKKMEEDVEEPGAEAKPAKPPSRWNQ